MIIPFSSSKEQQQTIPIYYICSFIECFAYGMCWDILVSYNKRGISNQGQRSEMTTTKCMTLKNEKLFFSYEIGKGETELKYSVLVNMQESKQPYSLLVEDSRQKLLRGQFSITC